jgi:phosphoglycolate phosphatase
LDDLAAAFKAHYDERGYRDTVAFPGVKRMLSTLSAWQVRMSVATNKRLLPTKKILDYLGWRDFFSSIYSLDAFNPPLTRKLDMLDRIASLEGLGPRQACYVGDRDDDGKAAAGVGFHFIHTRWGYEFAQNDGEGVPSWTSASSPAAAIHCLRALLTTD